MQVAEQLRSLIAAAGYGQWEPVIAGVHGQGGTADRTSAAVLSALAQVRALATAPGTAYAHSGVGYVCLAASMLGLVTALPNG